jgi:hypothetical protein
MLFLVAIFGCDFSCLYHSFGVHVNCSCCWAICATLCCNVLELVEKTDMRVSRCIHLYHLVLFFSTHLTHHLSHPPLKYVTQGFSYSFSIRIWLGLSKEQWSCQSLASSYLRLPFFSISSLPRSRRTRSARSTSARATLTTVALNCSLTAHLMTRPSPSPTPLIALKKFILGGGFAALTRYVSP